MKVDTLLIKIHYLLLKPSSDVLLLLVAVLILCIQVKVHTELRAITNLQ